jgi:transposase
MLKVDHARWDQTPEDLRQLSVNAEHERTRERFLALYEMSKDSYPTELAKSTSRHFQTLMRWVRKYNQFGPVALMFQHTGGRPPFAKKSRTPSAEK